jgi:hypothetical protein
MWNNLKVDHIKIKFHTVTTQTTKPGVIANKSTKRQQNYRSAK